jgi:hypothetical protein
MRRVAMVLATAGLIAVGMTATPAQAHDGWWGIQSGARTPGGNTPCGSGHGVVTGGISTTIGNPAITTMATTRHLRIIKQRRTATPDTATISSPQYLKTTRHQKLATALALLRCCRRQPKPQLT